MIVIYNKNGSITNLQLDSYVNQGSSGVNKIFVYIDGYEPSEWTMTAVFSLPNGTTNNLLVTTEDTEKYGEVEYKGRSFYLTQAQTYYAGNLGMTITLLDNNGRVLVTSKFDVIINETGVTPDVDETEITRQLYYSLLQELNTKLDTYYAQKQLLKLSDNYINEITNTNVLIRPYYNGEGQFSSMINNAKITEKNSDYQYRLNFDGEADSAYIDTHLSKTGSIYTAVTGKNAAININVLGDNSLLFAQLEGYANLSLFVSGDKDKEKLKNVVLATDYDFNNKKLSCPPLFLIANGGENAPQYGFAYNTQTNKIGYTTINADGSIVFHENGYVPLITTGAFRIYAHNGAGQYDIAYDTQIKTGEQSLATRDTDGTLKVAYPTLDDHAATKKYVDDTIASLNTWGSSLKQYMEYDESGYIQVSSNLQVNQNIICDGDIVENMTGYDIISVQSTLEIASTGRATITPYNCKVVKNGNALIITGSFKARGTTAGTINAQTISKIPYTIKIPSSVGAKITDLGSAFIGSCVMRACDSNYTGTEELNITFHKSSTTTISTLLSINTPWTITSNNLMTLGTTFSYQLVLLLNESLF